MINAVAHSDHPFRDNKAKPAQALRNATLHAPCPVCYTDCSEKKRSNASAFFTCPRGHIFKRPLKDARSHTSWLFTRGRAGVQAATTKEGQYA